MSDDRQELILLATSDIGDSSSSCSQGTTTCSSGVLTKLFSGSNTSAASSPSTVILYIPAFRKIEPKPGLDISRGEGEVEEKEVIEKETKSSVGRFLAINATKRGVKTCPVCLKKIGYRAKQCKHCSPSKIRNPRKPRLQHVKSSSLKLGRASLNGAKPNEMGSYIHNSSSGTTQCSQESSQNNSHNDVQGDLISSDTVDKINEEPIIATVTQVEEEQQFESMVSSQEDQPSLDKHVFESSLLGTTHQQELASVNTESQQMLNCASINQQNDQEQLIVSTQSHQDQQDLDALKQQEDQNELGASVSNILDQTDRQSPIVIEDAMVSTVTEVSSSGDSTQKIDEENGNHQVLNSVYISSKITQSIDPQTTSTITPGRYSLQDLICGLLAQNQGISVESNQAQPKESEENIEESVNIDIQTGSVKSLTSEEMDSSNKSTSEILNKDKSTAMSETSYDANSVALFLGEMAQRNNGIKRKMNLVKTADNEPKVVTLIPGVNQKCILLSGNEAKAAKFRKIQPKDVGNVQEEAAASDNDKETSKELSIENRGESPFRIMNGNATRRGVMSCSKCNKMIGCRSKICKHCKNNVTESPCRQVTSKTMKQSVKLCLPDGLGIQIFSVRKCKTGPELRCFVQFDNKDNTESSKSCNSKYSCDYPLCVTAKELGDNDYMCEHAKACCVSGSTLNARLPKLNTEMLERMPYGSDLKDSVQKLYSQCLSKGIALVQYVSSRTLAVVEQMNDESSGALGSDVITFAHVRFDNVKGQGCFQRQVFCSGRTCMAWNFLSNESQPAVMKSCSCVHYAAALWAIASDAMLQKDLGEYLEASVAQSKNGNS